MNSQITQLYGLVMLLFAILVGFTSYWSVFQAGALKDKRANRRPLLEAQQIRRGSIKAADGTVIAISVAKGKGQDKIFVRRYPQGKLFGHPVGYSFTDKGQSELERYHDSELVGETSEFVSILDELRGHKQEGDDLVTNLDPDAQRIALQDLQVRGKGAVVAIEPATGRVRVMASNPSFDPNDYPTKTTELNTDPASPILNRATQGQYPPGSTFKVVTAAAGLDSGEITPDTTINAPGSLSIFGQPLANDFNQDFGDISLNTALTNSVNTWFAQLGEKVGQARLFDYMRRFGFNSTPQIDLPDDQVFNSAVFAPDQSELGPSDPVDIDRLAIGQERLLVTPLQMAEVAAAIANDGKLMRPQIWDRVVDTDGRTIDEMNPTEIATVMSADTAQELTVAMTDVVNEGTGTAAALSGVDVAGKTGTADVDNRKACGAETNANQVWFIGFAPADNPQIAIAATVECSTGFGGPVMGPVFADVAEALLNG